MCVCVCVCVRVCVCVSLFVRVCVCLSVCRFVCLFVSLSLSFSVSVCTCGSLFHHPIAVGFSTQHVIIQKKILFILKITIDFFVLLFHHIMQMHQAEQGEAGKKI